MGQVVQYIKRHRKLQGARPKEDGIVAKASEVREGDFIYLEGFKGVKPKFYEVVKVEAIPGGVRLSVPSLLVDEVDRRVQSDFPEDFPLTVMAG